jgi:hypothetical protein
MREESLDLLLSSFLYGKRAYFTRVNIPIAFGSEMLQEYLRIRKTRAKAFVLHGHETKTTRAASACFHFQFLYIAKHRKELKRLQPIISKRQS